MAFLPAWCLYQKVAGRALGKGCASQAMLRGERQITGLRSKIELLGGTDPNLHRVEASSSVVGPGGVGERWSLNAQERK